MALSASTVFEVRSTATANNVNAGGFNPANANMATDLTTDTNTGNTAAPVVSSASYNFTATDVGHKLYVKSGTNWTPGWYTIASVAANKATLTASIGSVSVVDANNRYTTNTVVGCATVGTPTGGSWAIDYSQSDASPFSSTDLASTNGTTNPSAVTSATNPFTIAMAGNLLHVTAGTNWTAQWLEIVSVSGVTATLDKAAGTNATLSAGTGRVGGALNFGALDNAVFNLAVSTSTASARYFVKSGNYTITTVTGLAAANASWPIIFEGYATTRGDRPPGATRPVLTTATGGFTTAGNWHWFSCIARGDATSTISGGAQNLFKNMKILNFSASANQNALNISTGSTVLACELISYRGRGLNTSAGVTFIADGNYIHDCNQGIIVSTGAASVINNIVEGCVTAALAFTGASVAAKNIWNNTLYGAANKLGIGMSIVTGNTVFTFLNNIITGFVTGVSHADTQTVAFDDNNNYFNNTNDVSSAAQWQKGPNDVAVDPAFVNVVQRTGSTATTTSGNHLVQAGATFQTWGVVAGQDCVYISGGTGVTAGIYGILSVDSETQITTDITLTANATADKVWSITTGHNFAPTGAV